MPQNRQQTFIRADGSIDTARAMTSGQDARTEALRAGLARLSAWLRHAPSPAGPRDTAPLAPRR